jgi:hypothetical protein
MALTLREQQLLRHAPTPMTWLCNRKTGEGRCGAVNTGRATQCWVCCTKRPPSPVLLWPAYETACKKAGIETGDRWPARAEDAPTEDAPVKPTRRKKG